MTVCRRGLAVAVTVWMVLFAGTAFAESGDEDDQKWRYHHKSALQIRATPIGLSLWSDSGLAFDLWNRDGDLWDGTYFDAGVTTALSPAFAWGGPYVEFLPIAVLKLRFSAQFMGYFGNFGYLYVPDDGSGEWGLDALEESEDQSLGQATSGILVTAQATPQMRYERVVFQAETTFHWMGMDVEDQYYEPYYDMLFAPSDSFVITRPTLGYLFGKDLSASYLLVGARWERTWVRQTELTRDTLGMIFNWKIPKDYIAWGDPALSGFGGVFVDHPNRGAVSPYFGTQFTVNF